MAPLQLRPLSLALSSDWWLKGGPHALRSSSLSTQHLPTCPQKSLVPLFLRSVFSSFSLERNPMSPALSDGPVASSSRRRQVITCATSRKASRSRKPPSGRRRRWGSNWHPGLDGVSPDSSKETPEPSKKPPTEQKERSLWDHFGEPVHGEPAFSAYGPSLGRGQHISVAESKGIKLRTDKEPVQILAYQGDTDSEENVIGGFLGWEGEDGEFYFEPFGSLKEPAESLEPQVTQTWPGQAEEFESESEFLSTDQDYEPDISCSEAEPPSGATEVASHDEATSDEPFAKEDLYEAWKRTWDSPPAHSVNPSPDQPAPSLAALQVLEDVTQTPHLKHIVPNPEPSYDHGVLFRFNDRYLDGLKGGYEGAPSSDLYIPFTQPELESLGLEPGGYYSRALGLPGFVPPGRNRTPRGGLVFEGFRPGQRRRGKYGRPLTKEQIDEERKEFGEIWHENDRLLRWDGSITKMPIKGGPLGVIEETAPPKREGKWARKKAIEKMVDKVVKEGVVEAFPDVKASMMHPPPLYSRWLQTDSYSATDASSVTETSSSLGSQPYWSPESNELFKSRFSRTYDVLALRVPSSRSSQLMFQLAGHLLNWPKVKNIVRDDSRGSLEDSRNMVRVEVAGETFRGSGEVAEATRLLLLDEKYAHKTPMEMPRAVQVVLGIVGCEEKLEYDNFSGAWTAKEEGPSLSSDSEDDEVVENYRQVVGNEQRAVGKEQRVVVKEQSQVGVIKSKKRKGGFSEPVAGSALVMCHITLGYNYWNADDILREILPNDVLVPTAFESIGHIAHLNLSEDQLPFKSVIGQVILDKNPRIRTVVNKVAAITDEYRLMPLELLAGEPELFTTVSEHGFKYELDFSRVYWNSRLASERHRLISTFGNDDVICDVFCGVGPFAVPAARKCRKVHANDLNPAAMTYLARNAIINNVHAKIHLWNLDGREFIKEVQLCNPPAFMHHFVMNLPADACEFLDAFRGSFYRGQWGYDRPLPFVHVYAFSKGEDPEAGVRDRIACALGEAPLSVNFHPVRLVAPGKLMLCASFRLPEACAFDD